jgi:hypothetical protein
MSQAENERQLLFDLLALQNYFTALDDACGGDAALREQAQRLLADGEHHKRSGLGGSLRKCTSPVPALRSGKSAG